MRRFCVRCRIEIDEEWFQKLSVEKKMILCEKCKKEIDKKLELWYPKIIESKF